MLAEKAQGGISGFRHAPGLTEHDIADILGILPFGLASPMPIFVMGGRHAAQPEQLVLASESLLYVLGAKNLEALSRALFSGKTEQSQRIADFAATLVPNAPPRTERLRFQIGPAVRTITFLCCRAGAEGAPPLFAGAVLDLTDDIERAPALKERAKRASRIRPDAAGQNDEPPASKQQKDMFVPSRPGGASGRANLEGELRRLKGEFRALSAILDTATDGVAVLDRQGRILTLSCSGEALFGYDQSEVAGRLFLNLIAPESRALVTDYFEGLKSDAGVSLLNPGREVIGLARQGGTIPIFMTLGRIGGGSGAGEQREVRYCAILRDLTHWKKVERDLEGARKEAERASALKSDFLARVSHEIRTPLNAILGFAEVMMDESFGPVGNQRYKDYLGDIHASGTLVMSLVNDLLDLSKIEAGKMDFEFASIDANRIVAECVSIMQPQASQERVAIRLSLSPALPNLLADERSLRQIVLNLLSNAVKFNQPGGQVSVATALADAGSAVIRIRDTGAGMSEADIGAAFEPFQRLATARPSSGTGLGLPLTKALVEANHAALTIKSKPQEGTLVEVVFPRARILAE
ncbi:MAG TPA: ATP-binding protein [Methylocella sp.]|nr:ATP-binding protein [Methylocella sp.]